MLEVMAGPEPGDAYSAPPHDGAFAAACAEDPAPLRIGVVRDPPVGRSRRRRRRCVRSGAGRARAHGAQPRRGVRRAARGAHGAVRDGRARPDAPRCAGSSRSGASSCSSPRRARPSSDGEQIGVGEYVGSRGGGSPGDRRGARSDAPVRAARVPRAHAARRCHWTRSRPRRAAVSAGGPRSSGTPTPSRSTSRASRCSRCPAARRPTACPWACRSRGRWVPTPSCSRSAPPSNGPWPASGGRRRPRRARGRRADRGARALVLGARGGVPRAHPRARRRRTATRATRTRSTPGCGCTRRTRWTAAARADALLGESAPTGCRRCAASRSGSRISTPSPASR